MCILCGEFVSQLHWTDRHIEDKARAGDAAADRGAYHRDRRRNRHQRTKATNEVLRHYGLKVSDWGGSKYVVRDGKGRSEIVHDLGSLWPAAQKLAGRPLDPLDPALLGALTRGGRDG